MTEQIIIAVVAGVISIALEVVPGVRDLWDKLSTDWKATVAFVLCLGLPPLFVALACWGVDLGVGAACPAPGNPQMWVDAVILGVFAYIGSQGTFELLSDRLGARVRGGVG